jgi:hypothetical protein
MWPTKKLCASSKGGLAREHSSAGSLRQLGYEGFGIDVLAQRTNVRRRYDAAMLGGKGPLKDREDRAGSER